MQNKIKRKFVALILAASLAVSSLAAFPMNVFAGTGENGMLTAPKAKKVTEIFIFGYPANKTMNVGKDFTLTAAFFPPGAYADYKKVTWSSDNTDVATVNETTGEVKAVGAGTVTITATAKNGSDTKTDWVTKDVTVNVLQPVTDITIGNAPANKTMDVGDEFTLTAAFFPPGAYADYKKVTWSSDNTDVATVNETTGEVKAVGAGTVTITATAKNGSDTKTDWVTKDVTITVRGVTISGGPSNNTMDVNETYTLIATLSPENVSDQYKTVEWESSNTDVATVNASTGEVKAIAPGQATITATAKNGSDTDTDWVTKDVTITVRGVTLNKSVLALNSDEVESGVHEETLQATVLPEGADQIVLWESNNPGVATVDDNGLVKAVGEGQATITVTTANGRSATCKVYVCEVVVIKSTETSNTEGYVQYDIVANPVKLQFNTNYRNDKDWYGWYSWGRFTLTVVPADDSNITIQKCIFYHEDAGELFTSTGPNFSCEAFDVFDTFYGISRVDVYFTRNS